jgi:hypothetical protein
MIPSGEASTRVRYRAAELARWVLERSSVRPMLLNTAATISPSVASTAVVVMISPTGVCPAVQYMGRTDSDPIRCSGTRAAIAISPRNTAKAAVRNGSEKADTEMIMIGTRSMPVPGPIIHHRTSAVRWSAIRAEMSLRRDSRKPVPARNPASARTTDIAQIGSLRPIAPIAVKASAVP